MTEPEGCNGWVALTLRGAPPVVTITGALPTSAFFGATVFSELRRPCLIVDPAIAALHPHYIAHVAASLDAVGEHVIPNREPRAPDIEAAAETLGILQPESIVSVGGGSTIDTAKGIAVLLRSRTSLPERFAPGIGDTAPLLHVAVPTAAGPGAEFSPAMVFRNRNGAKIALVDGRLIPHAVVIAPHLATTLCDFSGS